MENDDSEPATASCLKTDFPSGGKEGGIPHDVVREVIDVIVVVNSLQFPQPGTQGSLCIQAGLVDLRIEGNDFQLAV